MPPKPVVLKKSLAGLLYICLTGLVLAAGILWLTHTALLAQPLDSGVIGASALAVLALDILGVSIFAYTYSQSRVVITRTHITVYDYPNLVAPRITECEVAQIEDVSIKDTGILAMLFGYATLRVQTAGSYVDLELTMISNAQHWQQYLMQLHDALEPEPTS